MTAVLWSLLTLFVLRVAGQLLVADPHERWTGGSRPIFFHWVLASFLLVVGRHHGAPKRKLRVAGWSLAGIAIAAWIAYQVSPAILAWTLDVRRPEYAVRIDRSVPMTTGDGIVLRADVYRPQRIAKSPTILVRIPFSKTFTNTQFATLVGRFWAKERLDRAQSAGRLLATDRRRRSARNASCCPSSRNQVARG